jgi:hypothetical protein
MKNRIDENKCIAITAKVMIDMICSVFYFGHWWNIEIIIRHAMSTKNGIPSIVSRM